MGQALIPAERRAVEAHREYLSQAAGHSIELDVALADWRAHHQLRWREARQARCLEQQRHEIERHKWLESEKAQCDMGKAAALDWITKHAADWRAWYDTQESRERV